MSHPASLFLAVDFAAAFEPPTCCEIKGIGIRP
jgi:hypothetical protein